MMWQSFRQPRKFCYSRVQAGILCGKFTAKDATDAKERAIISGLAARRATMDLGCNPSQSRAAAWQLRTSDQGATVAQIQSQREPRSHPAVARVFAPRQL